MTGVTVLAWRSRGFAWPAVKPRKDKADVVIIDARGTGFLPCLTPRLTDAAGSEVLSLAQLGVDEFQKHAMMIYIATPLAAEAGRLPAALVAAAEQAYENPLLLRADKSPKDMRGTLVLTRTATKTLTTRGDAKELVYAGKIVVVVDVPAAKS